MDIGTPSSSFLLTSASSEVAPARMLQLVRVHPVGPEGPVHPLHVPSPPPPAVVHGGRGERGPGPAGQGKPDGGPAAGLVAALDLQGTDLPGMTMLLIVIDDAPPGLASSPGGVSLLGESETPPRFQTAGGCHNWNRGRGAVIVRAALHVSATSERRVVRPRRTARPGGPGIRRAPCGPSRGRRWR